MKRHSIHLCLIAGADNRFMYLVDTIRVSRDYFHSIQLVDTGSTDETESLAFETGVSYRRLSGWGDNWPTAYGEAVREIPYGDWFLFLDSDERPSQRLLDALQDEITWLERSEYNCAYLPNMLHLSGQPFGKKTHDEASLMQAWPSNQEEYEQSPCWTKRNLIKFLPSTYIVSNGAHCSFCQTLERSRFLPRFYNHYKSENEIVASTVLCSWSCPEAYDVPKESPEWRRHHELREKTGLLTASQFLQVAQAGQLSIEWLDFWQLQEHSTIRTMNEYWKFAFEYNFMIRHESTTCGYACCRYRGEQL